MAEEVATIGLMGGTYDPPHFGHMHLAISLLEMCHLSEVWWCPAWINPHKQDENTSSASHRLAMTRLAVAGVPHMRVLDLECARQSISYTIDTVRELIRLEKARGSPRKIRLLLGADAAAQLPKWRKADELIRLAPPLVGRRSCGELYPLAHPDASAVLSATEIEYVAVPVLEINSTEIRKRFHRNLYNKHLLRGEVVDYIYEHGLYSVG